MRGPVLPILLLSLGLLTSLSACVTGGAGRLPPSQAERPNRRYLGVTTKDDKEVSFERGRPAERIGGVRHPATPYARIEADTLFAMVDGAPYRIALADTREVWFDDRRISLARTGLLAGGVIAGFAALTYIALATSDAKLIPD